jgi:hypothetical protein
VIYTTEEQAFRRAETVRLQGKWWPGVIRHRDGTFELTYDPADQVAPDLPSAPYSELGWEHGKPVQREPSDRGGGGHAWAAAMAARPPRRPFGADPVERRLP